MIKPFVRGAICKLLKRYDYNLIRPANALKKNPDALLEISLALLLESFFCREGRPPHILQIGANDGSDNDHLHGVLSRYDWPALLVEPQPDIFELLTQTYAKRPSIQFANYAISEEEKTAPLFRLHPDYHQFYPHRPDGLASFDRNHILKHLPIDKRSEAAITFVEVHLVPFNKLLENFNFRQVDALVIDTEGFDWEILKMFDIPTKLPSIIQYEWHHLGWPVVEESLEFLIRNGYRVHLLKTDVLACRNFETDRYDFESRSIRI